jgi:hypothetical protein
MLAIALVALAPTLVDGVRLKGDSANHFGGDPSQVSYKSPGDPNTVDDDEDMGLASAMLSEFANYSRLHPRRTKRKRDTLLRPTQKVAIVAVGHIRTFILPGVYSSMSTNLLGTFSGAGDYFFIGHRGKYIDSWAHGAENVSVTSYLNRMGGSEQKAATSILTSMLASITHAEIHDGSTCNDLIEARRQYGTRGPDCDSETNGHLMQVLWLDHAFQQIDRFGPYDLVVRIRPDVAVFKPFPWASLPTDRISYCDKRDMGIVDWVIVLPATFLRESWPRIVQRFVWQSETPWNSPDIAWKNSGSFDYAEYVDFPAIVVRSADDANCQHVKDDGLYDDCLKICQNGYFMDEH